MEFVGYNTGEKLMWTSGEDNTIKNTIIKQGSPKGIPTTYLLN